MNIKDYLFFIPPKEVLDKKSYEWNREEAKIYFNWFISIKDDRVEYLLTILDEELSKYPKNDLKRIGKKVTEILINHPFSERKNNELLITNKGLALAADMSLLISKLIITQKSEIAWKIVKRPRSDISYNLPAMFNIPKVGHVELIGGAINNAKGILRGERDNSIWLQMYLRVLSLFND